MLKKIYVFSIVILLLVGVSTIVQAKDKMTSSSTINEITVNWEYEVNESGEIENLKYTNATELSGKINLPSTLDNKTVVSLGDEAFKSAANITGVTVPNSIRIIGYGAFEGCTSLSSVDLGNITTLSFQVFKGCTSLTSITIPKTLTNGSVSPCLDNPNITNITLEEGLTKVPQNLCANTGITEITIPKSVTEIEYSAFENCKNLKKITILDNVTKMGFYTIDNPDSIFQNHNDDLTIYCYEDSIAAKYAIKYNIKYVYLERKTTENKNEEKVVDDNSKKDNVKVDGKDETTAPTKIPQTGQSFVVVAIIAVISIIGLIGFKSFRKNRDIK